MTQLERTTAIVTGASSGLGRAIAHTLAIAGSRVYMVARDKTRLADTLLSIENDGGQAFYSIFDIRDAERLTAFIQDVTRQERRLNILVNAAGVAYTEPITIGQLSEWREMFETNVLSVLVGCQAAITAMRESKSQGHIVNISSYAGRMNAGGVYGATKSAVDIICTTLHKELENDRIRIVNIIPGLIMTNMFRNMDPQQMNAILMEFGENATFRKADIFAEADLTRFQAASAALFASPTDVARAVLYAITQPPDVSISEIVVGPRKEYLPRL